MNKIECISYADFCSKYSVPDIDLVDLGLFKIEDLSSLRQLAGYLTGFKKLRNFLIHLPIYLKNFGFFSRVSMSEPPKAYAERVQDRCF